MQKIKILVISDCEAMWLDNPGGGISFYLSRLVKVLEKDYLVNYMSINELRNNKEIIGSYDWVLVNTYNRMPRKYKSKYIYVLHSSPYYLTKKRVFDSFVYSEKRCIKEKRFIDCLYYFYSFVLTWISFLHPPLYKRYKNIVLFNKYHNIKLFKNNNVSYGYIPLMQNHVHINFNRNNEILFLARLTDFDKNIKLLNEILDNTKLVCNVYGKGDADNMLTSKYAVKHGWIDNKMIAKEDTIKRSKVAIFTSRFEGCCISLHDCLFLGIIPITSNFSPEVEAIIPPELWDTLVIKNYKDINEWTEKIKHIMSLSKDEYKLMLNKIIQHYHKTYKDSNQFDNAWKEIIDNMSKRKPIK